MCKPQAAGSFWGFSAIAFALALLAVFGAAVFFQHRGNLACVQAKEKRIVVGDSLSGIIEDGDRIEILFGYYGCNGIRRDEIVAYSYAGSDEPLIKLVKAVPGDALELVEDGHRWRILVNGASVIAPDGEPYTVTAARYPRLHLYEKDYGQGLPPDTYMLLGTDPHDSFDSRAFGLVYRSDILGKVR